ncbi:E3 ubiquitin-protein ligase RGLG1 [Camellia lanceoleosa]|uniref:E3 ubiquitin-protein ligase RGLG1 n=1 Tax=Camellia lanceoleosa TaxID=1840588 RepID=A0ACC0HZA3_9ERIC|nr:E3 ubiquitin-protein ligase RGLG1 [Camellia lanceoleosa]
MTALAHNGLEAANLIIGIDFTRTNKWAGAKSFHGRSLHHIGDELNPYEQAISIIGRTLSGFLDNNLIPCFGFGDASTLDRDVFSFYPDKRICNGFEEVLTRPTSFAPIIEMAITIVEQSHRQYYVLLIIADGPVTGDANAYAWKQSPQIKETIEAVVKASYPREEAINRDPLPPPPIPEHPQPSSFCPSEPDFDGHNVAVGTSQPASSTSDDNTCCNCREDLQLSPICQNTIQT